MKKKVWLFKDYCGGKEAIFTSHKKAMKFEKEFLHTAIDMDWITDEYEIKEIKVNPSVKKFFNLS